MVLGLLFSSLCLCNSIDLVILHLLWWKQEDSWSARIYNE